MSKLELLVPTCLDNDHALDDTLTTFERKVLMIDDLTSLSPEHALTRAKRAFTSEALAFNTVTWARLFCHPSLPCHAYARLQLVISLFSLDLNHFHHLTLFANIHPRISFISKHSHLPASESTLLSCTFHLPVALYSSILPDNELTRF